MLKRLFPLAAVALLAPLALAQDKPAPPKPAPAPSAEKPAAEKPASTPAMASTLHVPVSGLTAENSEKVKAALTAATNTNYVCDHCMKADATAGACCGKDMTAKTGTACADVGVDAKGSTVSFSVPANRALRLSDVEKVLKTNGVTVQHDKLQIGSDATVMVKGVSDAAAGDAVKKAVQDAKLAELAEVTTSPATKEAKLTIRKSGATAATETRLKEAIGKANPSYMVADIVWCGPTKT